MDASRAAQQVALLGKDINQGGTARACLSSLEMKANAKAGVFQGEMASPFLLAERPLGQVGRSIREVKVIMAITDELAKLREQPLARIAEADTSAALESVRVAVLGKAGTPYLNNFIIDSWEKLLLNSL